MIVLKKIFLYFVEHFKKSINKRIYYFSTMFNKFLLEKNNYFLNLIGYNDNILKRFLKILFLYFFFRIIYDLILLILLILFEIYLIFIEVFFNILFDFRIVLNYLKKYSRIFIFIEDVYYRFIRWFYLFFSFNKIKLYKIKKFSFERFLKDLYESFFRFLSNLVWFFFIKKETRKKYLYIWRIIYAAIYIILCIIALIYLIFFQFVVLNWFFFLNHIKAKELAYYDWPKGKTRMIRILKLIGRFIMKVNIIYIKFMLKFYSYLWKRLKIFIKNLIQLIKKIIK